MKGPKDKQPDFFEDQGEIKADSRSPYQALSSVWERSDGELLEAMLSFYSHHPS